MAGKRNRLGRVHEPGKALSEPLREEIIEMYNEGFSVTDISNDVKVTARGVNKIINHYAHHGTLIPFCHGGSEADEVTGDVLHCIEIWKLQRPSIYAREIQSKFEYWIKSCFEFSTLHLKNGLMKRVMKSTLR